MKKFLMAAAAVSTLAMATPAWADGDNLSKDTEVFVINGVNPAKCNIITEGSTIQIPGNSISDSNGFASEDLDSTIAAALTAANISAFCTGNANSLVLSRSALTTGSGNEINDFNQAVIYDLQLTVAGATRIATGAAVEGSSDGPLNGPGTGVGSNDPLSRFGPSVAGSLLTFAAEPGATVDGVGTGTNAQEKPRAQYVARDTFRLVAGNYTGTVTLALSPGL